MIVNVDVQSGGVSLASPDDFKEFHIAAGGDDIGRVAEVIGADLSERENHVWLPIASVRAWAGERASDAAWLESFDGMLGYARSKGWVDDDTDRVEAHVEWA